MKPYFKLRAMLMLVFGLGCFISANAQSVDERYLRIYSLIQEADRLALAGQANEARSKYQESQSQLRSLQAQYPSWNESVIRFRLRYVEGRIGTNPNPPSPALTPNLVASPASAPGVPGANPTPIDQNLRDQILSLQAMVQRNETEKSVLELKLREALAAQPAAMDPRELARAQELIRTLEKEKEVLLVSLDQERARRSRMVEPTALDEAKGALTEANRKLVDQQEASDALLREKKILEGRLKEITSREASQSLRSENESLRRRLQERGSGIETPDRIAGLERDLADAKTALAANAKLLAEAKEGRLAAEKTKKNLEDRISALTKTAKSAEKTAAERIKSLESRIAELESGRGQSVRRARTASGREAVESDMAGLRAKLAALEAKKVPYSPEELALFKAPAIASAARPAPSVAKAPAAPARDNAAPLVAEAERAFAGRRYSDAEQKFTEALKLDSSNATTLANLAASQIEQSKFAEADATLAKALPSAPNDAYTLSLLGILRFRQNRFDDAFDALSRAVRIDPKNAETQNYLGITLSQKGQRAAAEAALRQAIQISPGYASAHHNLAVIYATQNPPFVELARWHYEKALGGGHPKNPEVEKLLEGRR